MNRLSWDLTVCFTLAVFLLTPACTTAANSVQLDCASTSIKPAPTATRHNDPDLSQAPQSASGATNGIFCSTPVPITTSITDYPEQFEATELVNLSLNPANQEIEAIAIGDDMLAVAWLTDGNIYVALSRGGSHFQVRPIENGEAVALVFSTVNRLHVTYEKDGQIYYRAADQGIHPADVASEFVADGTNPTVLLNQFNYAQIVFEVDDAFYHAAQFMHESWQIGRIDGTNQGNNATFAQFGTDLEFGYLIAYEGTDGNIHLARWHTTPYGFFPSWQPSKTIAIPTGETLHSQIGLDHLQGDGTAWAAASWVTVRPNPTPSVPIFTSPIFASANPLYPNSIGNPDHVYSGLNAVRWSNDLLRPEPYSAGLYQIVPVPTGTPLHFSAWGSGNSDLRVGIDPSGGIDSNSSGVVWSSNNTSNQFTEFNVSTFANSSQVTVFLEGTFSALSIAGITLWDDTNLQNSSLVNAGFEDIFVSQNNQQTPEGWTPYFEDGSFATTAADDIYTVQTVWSNDGGITWVAPTEVVQNREVSGSLSGAIPSNVFPLISAETETPTATFIYLYAAGNPPPNSDFIRFGRPFTAQCDLISAECTPSPGNPVLSRNLVRPVTQLILAKDTLDPNRATLVWTSRQSDTISHDIFATQLVLR
ncbi:MAG: hypothetical protein ACPG8W_03255 [Candidatus Promineifilaceae bacterium]